MANSPAALLMFSGSLGVPSPSTPVRTLRVAGTRPVTYMTGTQIRRRDPAAHKRRVETRGGWNGAPTSTCTNDSPESFEPVT